jgi:hypothetical protein
MIYHCSNFTNNWLNSEVLADGRSQSGSLIIDNQNMGYLLIAHQDGSNYQLLCLKSRPFVGIAERQDQRKLRKIVNLKKKKVDKFFYDITGKKVRNLKRGIYFENPFY